MRKVRERGKASRPVTKAASLLKRNPAPQAPTISPQRPAKDEPPTLVGQLRPGQTPQEALAEWLATGIVGNAFTCREWSASPFGGVGLTECLAALTASAERVNRGDLGAAEGLLMAQASTLNALFVNLCHRASRAQLFDHLERLLRLAFRAQGQSRATLETLSALKNPPALFAKQANITSGPQQVNNGELPSAAEGIARTRLPASSQVELLEGYGQRMDASAPAASGRGDLAVATVGTLHGTTHTAGEGEKLAQRRPWRRAEDRARTASAVQGRVEPSAGSAAHAGEALTDAGG